MSRCGWYVEAKGQDIHYKCGSEILNSVIVVSVNTSRASDWLLASLPPITRHRFRDVICTPIRPGVLRYMYRCVGVRQMVGGACKVTGGIIDVKTFFTFFLFWSPFYVFNVFYFPNVFLFKKTLAKFRAASR